MIITVILTIVIAYIAGVIVAVDMILLIETYKEVEFKKSEFIRLALGSWFSCLILNNILNKYD